MKRTIIIKISTLNAARYLERDTLIGSIEEGKKADLVLINGDLSSDVSAIRHMETVFKHGVGYNSNKIFAATRSVVGLH